MKRIVEAVCGFLLVTSALAVLAAGPLTANAAAGFAGSLSATARVLSLIALAI
jgi:hypothetical protein